MPVPEPVKLAVLQVFMEERMTTYATLIGLWWKVGMACAGKAIREMSSGKYQYGSRKRRTTCMPMDAYVRVIVSVLLEQLLNPLNLLC